MSPQKTPLDQAIDRFWETVPPLWSAIRAHIRAKATSEFDISVEQFHILRHVRRGTCSISDLATARNISRPAISQAVETLVQKNLLIRVQSKQDRRFVELALTQSGAALLETIFQDTRSWMKRLMGTLTINELENIAHAMDAMKQMVDDTTR